MFRRFFTVDSNDIGVPQPYITDDPFFKSAIAKIQRAKFHFIEMKTSIEGHIRKFPYQSGDFIKNDNGTYTVKTQIKPLTPEISAIIGDFFHNCRCSLDHLATGLARRNGKSDHNVYFPFSNSSNEIDAQITKKNFYRCGASSIELLKTLKPYHGGNELLRAVHDIDVYDKHIAIIPEMRAKPIIKINQSFGKIHSFEVSEQPYVFPAGMPLARQEVVKSGEAVMKLCESILKSFVAL